MTDMQRDAETAGLPTGGHALPDGFWTFGMVEERLIEAMIICWRNPDRERGWQTLRSAWPDVLREVSAGDYDARGGDLSSSEVALRPAAVTRAEQGEMDEAFGWLDHVAPEERKVVGLAIIKLASGKHRAVPWRDLLRPMGMTRGADGLRMRYGRAITAIANRLNGGNPQGIASRG